MMFIWNCKKCPAWIPQPHSIQFSGVGPEHEPASTIQPASAEIQRNHSQWERERKGEREEGESERERQIERERERKREIEREREREGGKERGRKRV